jgi:cytochrome c oxidase subunit 2
MFRKLPHQLLSWIFPLALVLTLAANLASMKNVQAQTRDTWHQVNNTGDGKLNAHGKPADMSKSFFERYAAPKDISSYGHHMTWLFNYTSLVTFLFFLLMASILIGSIVLYRDRPGRVALYTHGHSSKMESVLPKFLDLAVFISLDLVLICSSFLHTGGQVKIPWTNIVFKSVDDGIWNFPSGPDVVRVQIYPQQWAWNFRYPGLDGQFGTEDDITTLNQLVVPKGKKIMAQIKAKDVIHGFWITNVRLQMDAIPGMVTKFWFDANENGDYEITCAHHCGTFHYKMKAFLKVVDTGDFQAWVKENSDWAKAAYDVNDPSTKWGWNWSLYQ